MNVRHPMGVLQSFSIKNIFYDKMDLRLFYFGVTIYTLQGTKSAQTSTTKLKKYLLKSV